MKEDFTRDELDAEICRAWKTDKQRFMNLMKLRHERLTKEIIILHGSMENFVSKPLFKDNQ